MERFDTIPGRPPQDTRWADYEDKTVKEAIELLKRLHDIHVSPRVTEEWNRIYIDPIGLSVDSRGFILLCPDGSGARIQQIQISALESP